MADTLKRYTTTGVTNSANTLYTAGSGVTATMLSISLCNIHATTDVLFDLKVMDGGSTEYYLYRDQSLPAQATFIHNGKLTLKATDTLVALTNVGATVDVYISVLEQT
tara:strand:+ start:392 stop:715 length:324 start_codon:yes stop_codon:yes gene_type:complete